MREPPDLRDYMARKLSGVTPAGKPAALAGRAWRPELGGPSVIVVRGCEVVDVSHQFPTLRDLCEAEDPAGSINACRGETVGTVAELARNADPLARDQRRPWLLAPVDLQVTKAAGVTFNVSLVERVIEERSGGDAAKAALVRSDARSAIGRDLDTIRPGSEDAARLKTLLQKHGMWSQYLEVGIGPDAELFTKAPSLSVVGTGMDIGIARASGWNNPEPEVVLVISSDGRIKGATLGNDVNLRDFEGRSALLLGRAKDNNASAAIGPFIRFFDGDFCLADVERLEIDLMILGADGFSLKDRSSMTKILRSPAELVSQLMGKDHQYPDGVLLYTGTMFVPTMDRKAPGKGFTHDPGDVVVVSNDRLGCLINRVRYCDECAPWSFGLADMMRNLSERSLLNPGKMAAD